MSATPWLTLLLVLFPLSTAWSVAPEETLRRGFAMLATGLFGFYLAARFDHRDLVRLLVQALGVTMVLSLLAGLLVPSSRYRDGGPCRSSGVASFPKQDTVGPPRRSVRGFLLAAFCNLGCVPNVLGSLPVSFWAGALCVSVALNRPAR